ncbi:MAG: endo alpha-1,4 polygalactosaminidase [Myxococcales bacterium]|nr:endo alpha-1,4 polygalactosaminidase [Myxococcales bacterium]
MSPRLARCLASALVLLACKDPDDGGADATTTATAPATSTAPTSGEPATTEITTGDDTTPPTTAPDDTTAAPTTAVPETGDTSATTTTDPTATTDVATDTTATTGDPPAFALPPPDGGFDYQLGSAYPPPDGVVIVTRDRTAAPAPGLYNLCYVNGFQAQPDAADWWLDEHPDLVLRDGMGDPVIDVDWDEMLLDTGTPEKRAAIAAIVGEWIAGCAADGFDAVEIDNLDSYSRSMDLLTQDDNVATMALLSAAAHAAGLAIAQKNSTELLDRRAEMGTDLAVSEECSTYDECGDYVGVYGDAVLMIEYIAPDFAAGCAAWPGHSIVLRDLDLVGPRDGGYVFDAC